MKKERSKIPEITVTYNPKIKDTPKILSSNDSYVLFLDYFPKDSIQLQERLVVMYLNNAQKVIGIYVASIGGLTCTIADTRLILAVALKTASTRIIIAHNHPAGDLKPSQFDIILTNKIKEACVIMDLKLLDHLIISPEDGKYYSFLDEGLI